MTYQQGKMLEGVDARRFIVIYLSEPIPPGFPTYFASRFLGSTTTIKAV